MPGGASGVLLKLKLPNKYAYEDNFGLTRAVLMRFKVSSAWIRRQSYPARGEVLSHVANPARQ